MFRVRVKYSARSRVEVQILCQCRNLFQNNDHRSKQPAPYNYEQELLEGDTSNNLNLCKQNSNSNSRNCVKNLRIRNQHQHRKLQGHMKPTFLHATSRIIRHVFRNTVASDSTIGNNISLQIWNNTKTNKNDGCVCIQVFFET